MKVHAMVGQARLLCLAVGVFGTAGCYDGGGPAVVFESDTQGTSDSGDAAGDTNASAASAGPGPGSAADDGGGSDSVGTSAGPADGTSGDGATEDTGGSDPAAQMCARWNADRSDMSEGDWSGNIAACDPGDISAAGRASALRLVNLYRWLAELPEVTDEAVRNAGAQACALMMDANGALSHSPPTNWTCWSGVGSDAAGSSNISTGPGVMSVDMYMVDFGNASTLGHRRWIMSNSLGPIGLGSTSESSCMWVIGGDGDAGKAWTAYPPPGPFPFEAVSPLPFGDNLDVTGWSIQSDTLELAGAQVTITQDGMPRPVGITVLGAGYGSTSAISMIPQGWTATPGATYHVEVTGVGAEIAYDVTFVEC